MKNFHSQEEAMNKEQELLSQMTVHTKYARFWGELGRREVYPEIVARNRQMHIDHVKALALEDEERVLELIDEAYRLVSERKVFPSMRSFQFGGEAIHRSHDRIYNCSFMFANEASFFSDLMFLLLGGTGVGYSVQRQHIEQLPTIKNPGEGFHYVISDDIVGWAGAVEVLVDAFMEGGPLPLFDYSSIRPEGAILKTSGGRAPGPEPLRQALDEVRDIFMSKQVGERLSSLEVHDMACIIARAVLSGGIRRSAMISLFSPDDEDMLTAKSGAWWETRPERAFANNSAVLLRGRDDDLFHSVFDRARESGSGEPGVYWVDDLRYGTNPCAEITLNNKQFCNLTTMNAGTITDQQDFNQRARVAGLIGTLQASYTDFHFLSSGWKEQTEQEALLGVSMTGIASGAIDNLDATEAASHAVAANAEMADLLGINRAARVTAIKPEGTASIVAGTSSGIHAWHSDYFIRRVRYMKTEPIAKYLMSKLPYRQEHVKDDPEIVEDDVFNDKQIVVSIPQKSPDGAVTREEGAMALLERVKRYHSSWIKPGNVYNGMSNNISATINIQDHEWDMVKEWMWNNRYDYNGLSLLPYSDHSYLQAPFEECTEERYLEMKAKIDAANIDFTEISEVADYTDHKGELACVGGACELPDWGVDNR